MEYIPQIFYDLIARVIPSSILLIVIFLSIGYPPKILEFLTSSPITQSVDFSKLLSFWGFSIILILAYVIGFILKLPSEWVAERKIIKRLFWIKQKDVTSEKIIEELEKAIKNLPVENKRHFQDKEGKLVWESKNIPDAYTMHDLIRMQLPRDGYRILKLQAERRLCELLFMGFLVLGIVNLIMVFLQTDIWQYRLILSLILLLSTIPLLKTRYALKKLFYWSTVRTWYGGILFGVIGKRGEK